MNLVPCLVILSLVVTVAAVAPAQAIAPAKSLRFTLPEVPYDYTPRVAAGLGERFSLPLRDGSAPGAGCGPALPPLLLPEPPDRFDDLVTLGRVLFHDPLLSKNGTRSCASCHRQKHGFADPRPHSRGFQGRPTKRNSMAIANLGLHGGPLFWDGRAATLEQMVLLPIEDPIEMGLPLHELGARLAADPAYAELFTRAFGVPGVKIELVAAALAQFVRSIVSMRSRYDEGLAATGDVDLDFPGFTPAENRGKRLFFGTRETRTRSCAACHAQRVYGFCGNTFEIDVVNLQGSGFFANGSDRGRAGDDPGRGAVTQKPQDRGRFRAPSLRNIQLTAPYMHDGRFATLDQVMDFYATQVRAHPNLDPLLASGPAQSPWSSSAAPAPAPALDGGLHAIVQPSLGVPLSSRDRADLVAFLKTLTDWALVHDERFADPFAAGAPDVLGRQRGR